MTGRLKDKRAIVTGAGQGIGAAIAAAFAREGAKVLIAEKNAETGRAAADAIAQAGGHAVFHETDVTDRAAVEAMRAAAVGAFGGIDVLVNNAGANVFYEPLQMPEEAWEKCLKLDLEAAWLCARAVLPDLLEAGGGAIVNIASTHSFKIIPRTFPYPVAKHALIGLTRALAIDYADKNIRVNAIAPGYTDTQIARDYWAQFPDPAAERSRAENLHPPRRIARPEEIAMTAVFLASDEAPFLNAQAIVVDGGRSVLYHE
jgi:NAD(P)-dependent dehydrogenase (short-subunit alcohol dehydrogenase family)